MSNRQEASSKPTQDSTQNELRRESTIEVILGSAQELFREIDAFLQVSGIDMTGMCADHICYRTGSIDSYEAKHRALSQVTELLDDKMIDGRRFAKFKSTEPVVYDGLATGRLSMMVVEMPAPKPGVEQVDGWEHVEFVVPTELRLEELVSRYPYLSFDTRFIADPINPKITVQIPHTNPHLANNPIVIRFHKRSLEEVIAMEAENKNKP